MIKNISIIFLLCFNVFLYIYGKQKVDRCEVYSESKSFSNYNLAKKLLQSSPEILQKEHELILTDDHKKTLAYYIRNDYKIKSKDEKEAIIKIAKLYEKTYGVDPLKNIDK